MVRSRAIWLKSTKIRAPRSSFHQLTVTWSGIRRDSSRPSAITACRASMKPYAGSIGTNTWTPRPPLVFGNPTRSASSNTERSSWAARAASAKSVPGCGSRSIRSWSTFSVSVRSPAMGGNGVCRDLPSRRWLRARSQTSSAVRPDGKAMVTVSTQSGMPFDGARFRIERLAVAVASGAELDVGPISTRPTLHGDGPILQRRKDAVAHGNHVRDDVQLGQPDVWEVDLVRAGHPYGAVTDLELDRWHRHGVSIGEYCREQAYRAMADSCARNERQT